MIITWNLWFSMGFPTWKPGQLSPGMPFKAGLPDSFTMVSIQLSLLAWHLSHIPYPFNCLIDPSIWTWFQLYYCILLLSPKRCSFSQTSAFFTFCQSQLQVNHSFRKKKIQDTKLTKPSHKISIDFRYVNRQLNKRHETSPRVKNPAMQRAWRRSLR